MGYYRFINRVKWYYRLKPKKDNNKIQKGLFSDFPRHTLTKALIISLSYYDETTNKIERLFGTFKTYLEYGIYMMKMPQKERCFYEVILGENSQKPHFDIDIENSSNEVINGDKIRDNLLDSIIKVLGNKGISIDVHKDILIFTSHGNNKQSYHVIVDNYCHANNVEAKAFYHKVVDNMSSEYAKWIDSGVYSSVQQFRIPGSRKIGSERVKVFNKIWHYHDQEIIYKYPETPDGPEHELVMQLEASIVGYTGNCKFLPAFEPKPESIKHYTESEDISASDATEAIKLIGMAGKINVHDPRFPYKFLGINGPIVMLKRIKPSRCKICNRIHEHENPYLLVIGEEKNVYFHCRRASEDKKLYLGKLNPINNSTIDNSSPINNDEINNNSPIDKIDKIKKVKISWTKNVIERAQRVAQSSNPNDKKYINTNSEIDPIHREQLIQIGIDNL